MKVKVVQFNIKLIQKLKWGIMYQGVLNDVLKLIRFCLKFITYIAQKTNFAQKH